jgi:hypothetical protein
VGESTRGVEVVGGATWEVVKAKGQRYVRASWDSSLVAGRSLMTPQVNVESRLRPRQRADSSLMGRMYVWHEDVGLPNYGRVPGMPGRNDIGFNATARGVVGLSQG